MRAIRILAVCGSGTVSSAMLALKIKDTLNEYGYSTITTEISALCVDLTVMDNDFDLIAYTTPIDEYNIPSLNAAGFIIGINEEEFIEELLEIVSLLQL